MQAMNNLEKHVTKLSMVLYEDVELSEHGISPPPLYYLGVILIDADVQHWRENGGVNAEPNPKRFTLIFVLC